MKHYTNKKTLETCGYKTAEVAKQYSEDFNNLVEMTDELFQEFREQPAGGKWTLNGWIIDEEIVKQQKKTELTHLIAQKEQELLIANLRGKDISTILKDLDDLEKELAEYD